MWFLSQKQPAGPGCVPCQATILWKGPRYLLLQGWMQPLIHCDFCKKKGYSRTGKGSWWEKTKNHVRWEIRGWCYRLHELRINFSTFCCRSRTWRLLMDKGSNIFPVAKYKSSVACFLHVPSFLANNPIFCSQPNSVEQKGWQTRRGGKDLHGWLQRFFFYRVGRTACGKKRMIELWFCDLEEFMDFRGNHGVFSEVISFWGKKDMDRDLFFS